MRKCLFVFVLFFGLGALPNVYAYASPNQIFQLNQKVTTQKLQTLRVMISKLRDLVYNLRDINQLEEIGMPHQDVLLMKEALQQKISQMQTETVSYIREL